MARGLMYKTRLPFRDDSHQGLHLPSLLSPPCFPSTHYTIPYEAPKCLSTEAPRQSPSTSASTLARALENMYVFSTTLVLLSD